MTKLRLAENLTLPLDAVTQRFAFLGRIGSGKTYAATKLIELMLEARAQVVALDPVGKCYGLRVPGTGPAFDIPIFGGLHGDVPLEPTGGALIADLVVDRTLSCVIDVSQFASDAEKARFASAFAERFFFRKKSSPSAVHVFLEECQEFVPQNTARGEELMLHHWTRMAKLGRNFGIGLSLASQRPQEVNKKVLNLTECLFAFQLRGKHERDAVKDWITEKDSDRAILDELPKLAVGDAIVDSPQWLGTTKRVRVFAKRTADVSATPKVGETPASERPLTEVDIAKVRDAMAATIERANADDPKELRKQLAAVTRERDEFKRAAEKAVPSGIDVRRAAAEVTREYVLQISKLRKALEAAMKFIINVSAANFDVAGVDKAELERAITAATEKATALLDQRLTARAKQIDQLRLSAERIAAQLKAVLGDEDVVIDVAVAKNEPFSVSGRPERRPVVASPSRLPTTQRAPRESRPSTGLGKTPQRMLNAMLFFERIGVTQPLRSQVAGFVGISSSTGTFRNYLSELRAAQCIDDIGTERVTLTDTGRGAASDDGLPTSRVELHAAWRRKFGSTPAVMFDALVEAWPDPMTRADLAAAAGIDSATGTFRNYLSELRTPGVLEDVSKSEVRAADMLFPEGLS